MVQVHVMTIVCLLITSEGDDRGLEIAHTSECKHAACVLLIRVGLGSGRHVPGFAALRWIHAGECVSSVCNGRPSSSIVVS